MGAKVRIESIHGDDEPIVEEYSCTWDIADGREYIRYKAGDMLTVKPDEVIIDEAGQIRAHIVLRPDGEIRTTAFETPYGVLGFDIDTHYLRMVKMPGRLVIETGYSLMAQGEVVNQVEMTIEVVRNATDDQ